MSNPQNDPAPESAVDSPDEARRATLAIGSPLPGARGASTPADQSRRSSLQPATMFADRYRILSQIGRGGMGVVYLAEHVRIEKRVALKVLPHEYSQNHELVERFLQEAKAASRIGHPHIVDVSDCGVNSDGTVFLAMEYLPGHDLSAELRAVGAMPFERARKIVMQVCRALEAAHSKGIHHRDVKPENIFLIERDGNPDFVKLLDFGLAKFSSRDTEGPRLTAQGMTFGTPEYMAPEQAAGTDSDHRVDLYALGCILYEMLTGAPPFVAQHYLGVLHKQVFEPAPSLAERADLPVGAAEVVARALAKIPGERFASAQEMAAAIAAIGRAAVDNQPIAETPAERASATAATPPIEPPTPPPAAPATAVAAATPPSTREAASAPEAAPPGNLKWVIGGAILVGGALWLGLSLRPDRPINTRMQAAPLRMSAVAAQVPAVAAPVPAVAAPVPAVAAPHPPVAALQPPGPTSMPTEPSATRKRARRPASAPPPAADAPAAAEPTDEGETIQDLIKL